MQLEKKYTVTIPMYKTVGMFRKQIKKAPISHPIRLYKQDMKAKAESQIKQQKDTY